MSFRGFPFLIIDPHKRMLATCFYPVLKPYDTCFTIGNQLIRTPNASPTVSYAYRLIPRLSRSVSEITFRKVRRAGKRVRLFPCYATVRGGIESQGAKVLNRMGKRHDKKEEFRHLGN